MRLLGLAFLAACTTSTTTMGPGGVVPQGTARFDMTIVGGLTPAPAAGSTCQPANDHYTYVLATRALSWSICSDPNSDLVFVTVTGQKTLAQADADQLVTALEAVQPATMACGGDVTETFVFTAADGAMASHYANCMPGASEVVDLIYSDAP